MTGELTPTPAGGETPLDRLLDRLERVRPQRGGWSSLCPAHDDHRPSLSISEGDDGKIVVKCHAGCTAEAIVAAVGLGMKDLFPAGEGAISLDGGATAQRFAGCTLEEYAAAKGLPLEFLALAGLSTISYLGRSAVRIPYFDRDGHEVAVRIRAALDGDDRFRWKKGSKPQLYGLNRLKQAREAGYVVLVEGESDVHTVWHHGYPALGLPGAAQWVEARDAAHLDGLDAIYVVIEPDQGGEAVLGWLAESAIRDRVRLVQLEDAGDVSELHLTAGDRARESIEAALQLSTPWSEQARIARNLANRTAWEECASLVSEPDVLARMVAELEAAGLAGERRTAQLLFLALVSRLLEKPVSVVIKGPSAAGKSYTLKRVLELFPDDAYCERTAMSGRALVYGDEPLAHRILVIYEASGLEGDLTTYLIRSLLSEGKLRYETVDKNAQGGLHNRLIEREGPTGLIVTTTAISLHPENETRLLSLPVTDTPEQTRRVLLALASEPPQVNAAPWHALQTWLATGATEVEIPYALTLAELSDPAAIRLRRDFGLLLSLIKAHALVHRATRTLSPTGAVIATLEDYRRVRDLVYDLIAEGVDASVPATVRETVEAVDELTPMAPEGVSVAQLAQRLNLDKGPTSRRVSHARNKGYLKNLEDRKGRPAKIVLGDPLPPDREILPTPETLAAAIDGEPLPATDSTSSELAVPEQTESNHQGESPQVGACPPTETAEAGQSGEDYATEEHDRIKRKFPDMFARDEG